jgi:hypothetical protein
MIFRAVSRSVETREVVRVRPSPVSFTIWSAMFSNERFNQLLSEHLNTLMGARFVPLHQT